MKRFLKTIGLLLLALMAIASGVLLFFEDQANSSIENLQNQYLNSQKDNLDTLKIAYLFAPDHLNPFSENLNVKARIYDVYEPLVELDANFVVKPKLAVTFGMIDQVRWEFLLRQNVKFHHGETLEIEDVFVSLEKAKSEKSFLNYLESWEKTSDHTFIITLKNPDPLFLTKLSRIMIVPEDFENIDSAIGTGPYQIVDAENLNQVFYQKFENYWGEKPYFNFVQILAIPEKNARIDGLIKQNIDFLVNVPPDAVDELKNHQLTLKTVPSLDVGMLMFQVSGRQAVAKNIRQAIQKTINKEDFLDLSSGFARTLNQFVGSGVFGFNPNIVNVTRDLTAARDEIVKTTSVFQNYKMNFYYPENLNLLGDYLKEQLNLIGIEIALNPLSEAELSTKLKAKELGFYYFGWRHDFADLYPFLRQVIHSKGELNGMNYQNAEVDKLIENSEFNLNTQERMQALQKAMKIAVEDDLIGIGLFETQSIFAYQADLSFQARLDSAIYPSKISRNKTDFYGWILNLYQKIKTELNI